MSTPSPCTLGLAIGLSSSPVKAATKSNQIKNTNRIRFTPAVPGGESTRRLHIPRSPRAGRVAQRQRARPTRRRSPVKFPDTKRNTIQNTRRRLVYGVPPGPVPSRLRLVQARPLQRHDTTRRPTNQLPPRLLLVHVYPAIPSPSDRAINSRRRNGPLAPSPPRARSPRVPTRARTPAPPRRIARPSAHPLGPPNPQPQPPPPPHARHGGGPGGRSRRGGVRGG